jgi:hypothetical protein
MKLIISLSFLLCLTVLDNVHAGPLTVRCYGHRPWGDQIIEIEIEMVIPDKRDHVVSLYSPEKKNTEIPNITPVGISTIQISEKLGDSKSSHRHQFVVSRLPDERNSLIGFYLINSYVNAIRADIWKEGKPFLYLILIITRFFKVPANNLQTYFFA